MAIYKNSYKVVIKTLGGTEVTANDATVAGVGSSAMAALMNGQDVYVLDGNGGGTFIPFHAVESAVVTLTRSEAEAPADETCVTE